MRKTKTWKDNLNDVVRDVIFPDEEMMDYMMIPANEREDIIRFIDKYFIRNPAPDELVTTEYVRVCYGELAGRSIGKHMLDKLLFFDVYVKNDHLHDIGDDMLAFRTDAICQRLKELLTWDKYVCNIDFRYEDDYPLFTKMIGYTRHRIVFSYKISF